VNQIQIVDRPIGGQAVKTVNARDLHAFLEVGKVFGAWIQERIAQYGFVDGRDFEVFSGSGNNPLGGRPSKEYALSLDMAKELAMVERTEKGKQARAYFIECERQAKSVAAPMLTTAEQLMATAQVLVEQDRRQRALEDEQRRLAQVQAESAETVAKLEQSVQAAAESIGVWDHCPANAETISSIRERMHKLYGLPSRIVDMVMRELPDSLKVHGMVRNPHPAANGKHYEVWARADVTRVFARFFRECRMATATTAEHPYISFRFRLATTPVKVNGTERHEQQALPLV
jgi:phage anti-repressor protein